jgi:hypothetical protein
LTYASPIWGRLRWSGVSLLQAEQGKIAAWVSPSYLGSDFNLAGEDNTDLLIAFNHMVGGQNQVRCVNHAASRQTPTGIYQNRAYACPFHRPSHGF